MKVLVVEPEKHPYEKDIDSGLKALQAEVGGLIQTVYDYFQPVHHCEWWSCLQRSAGKHIILMTMKEGGRHANGYVWQYDIRVRSCTQGR